MAKKLAKERASFIVVLILLVLLVGWWAISSFTHLSPSPSRAGYSPNASPTLDNTYVMATPVVVHHALAKGVHTYTGVLAIPTDCDALSTGVVTHGSNPVHVEVLLAVLRTNDHCASAGNLAGVPFSVSFGSSGTAPTVFDGVMVNNVETSFSIVENK